MTSPILAVTCHRCRRFLSPYNGEWIDNSAFKPEICPNSGEQRHLPIFPVVAVPKEVSEKPTAIVSLQSTPKDTKRDVKILEPCAACGSGWVLDPEERCPSHYCDKIKATLTVGWDQVKDKPAPDAPTDERGFWPIYSLQRAFVEGSKWWLFKTSSETMFPSEYDTAEREAVKRYGPTPKRSSNEMPEEIKAILGVGQKFPKEQQEALDLVNAMKLTKEHDGKDSSGLLYALDVIVNLLRVDPSPMIDSYVRPKSHHLGFDVTDFGGTGGDYTGVGQDYYVKADADLAINELLGTISEQERLIKGMGADRQSLRDKLSSLRNEAALADSSAKEWEENWSNATKFNRDSLKVRDGLQQENKGLRDQISGLQAELEDCKKGSNEESIKIQLFKAVNVLGFITVSNLLHEHPEADKFNVYIEPSDIPGQFNDNQAKVKDLAERLEIANAQNKMAQETITRLMKDSTTHEFIACSNDSCRNKEEHCYLSWCGAPRDHPSHKR